MAAKTKEVLKTKNVTITKDLVVIKDENVEDSTSYFQDIAEVKTAYDEVFHQANETIRPLLDFDNLKIEDYEEPSHATYIGIDDVCNKKQKAKRCSAKNKAQKIDNQSKTPYISTRKDGKKQYKKRKFLYHTVIKVVTTKGNYTLTAPKIGGIWITLIALLINNNRLSTFWIGLVDGQRTLHDFLTNRLFWKKHRLLLDWYHLRKKVHSQIHMGLNKSDERDEIMMHIEQLLWYGLIPNAIVYINQISEQHIKDKGRLKTLIGYIERNEALIPNYALRKQLGLVLSSNRVEKENDFIVAARQKHNGMSWTRNGSDAIALITTNQRNNELDKWLKTQTLDFTLAA